MSLLTWVPFRPNWCISSHGLFLTLTKSGKANIHPLVFVILSVEIHGSGQQKTVEVMPASTPLVLSNFSTNDSRQLFYICKLYSQ